jgi:hypothetical protein
MTRPEQDYPDHEQCRLSTAPPAGRAGKHRWFAQRHSRRPFLISFPRLTFSCLFLFGRHLGGLVVRGRYIEEHLRVDWIEDEDRPYRCIYLAAVFAGLLVIAPTASDGASETPGGVSRGRDLPARGTPTPPMPAVRSIDAVNLVLRRHLLRLPIPGCSSPRLSDRMTAPSVEYSRAPRRRILLGIGRPPHRRRRVHKIIRALALIYACCVSDSATAQDAYIGVESGSHALMLSHAGAVASLIEEAASAP